MEKCPDWRERLIDSHMRFCVSPFHDKDVWSELDIEKHPDREEYIKQNLGQLKTAHYHIMFHCDSNTTFKTMKEITSEMNLPVPFVVRSPYGMYRYFCHQDNPEKCQYDQHDIRHYNGSDPFDYIMESSKYDQVRMKKELTVFMRGKRFVRMSDFILSIADSFNDPRYEYIAQTNINYFKEMLKDNLSDMKTSIMAEARKYVD